MREITEAQAQELANLSGCKIITNAKGAVEIRTLTNYALLPIRIKTTLPWIEQIWRPQE